MQDRELSTMPNRLTRTARPTDPDTLTAWEDTTRFRRGRKPRPLIIVEEQSDLAWDEAVDKLAHANQIIVRIAKRLNIANGIE